MVRPEVVVMLGASAARGMLGKTVKFAEHRKLAVDPGTGGSGIVTVHPRHILRLPDDHHRREAFDQLVQDWQRAFSLAGAV